MGSFFRCFSVEKGKILDFLRPERTNFRIPMKHYLTKIFNHGFCYQRCQEDVSGFYFLENRTIFIK
jgi:hypothetical protein